MFKQMFFPFFFPAEGDIEPSPQTTYLVPEIQATSPDQSQAMQIPPKTESACLAPNGQEKLLGILCFEAVRNEFWKNHRMVANEHGTMEIKPIQKWTIGLAAEGIISIGSVLSRKRC